MGCVGVGFVPSGYQIHDPANAPRQRGRGMIKHLRGLRNEVRKVDVGLILLRERKRGGRSGCGSLCGSLLRCGVF